MAKLKAEEVSIANQLEGTIKLQNDQFIAPIIKAIQELKAELDEALERINELEEILYGPADLETV